MNASCSPNALPEPLPSDDTRKATSSLVLGLVGVIAWIIPLFGFPVCIVGLVRGIQGLESSKRGYAIAGIVLSSIFLMITLLNSIAGVIINAAG